MRPSSIRRAGTPMPSRLPSRRRASIPAGSRCSAASRSTIPPAGRSSTAGKSARGCWACASLPVAAPEGLDGRRHDGLAVAGSRTRGASGRAGRGEFSAGDRQSGGASSAAAPHRRSHGGGAGRQGRGRLRQAAELLHAAKHPNVAVKATGAPGTSSEPYPYRNVHTYIRQIYDAFGPRRMFWGTSTSPACRARGANASPCSRRSCRSSPLRTRSSLDFTANTLSQRAGSQSMKPAIAFANHKGGVGKTTSAVNVASGPCRNEQEGAPSTLTLREAPACISG